MRETTTCSVVQIFKAAACVKPVPPVSRGYPLVHILISGSPEGSKGIFGQMDELLFRSHPLSSACAAFHSASPSAGFEHS